MRRRANQNKRQNKKKDVAHTNNGNINVLKSLLAEWKSRGVFFKQQHFDKASQRERLHTVHSTSSTFVPAICIDGIIVAVHSSWV